MENFGGDWTLQKLDILKKYLHAYTSALKKQNLKLIYIDAFAGSGECHFKAHDNEGMGFFPEYCDVETLNFHDGSARIALKLDRPFDKYIFVDKKQESCDALRTVIDDFPHLSGRIHIVQEETNQYLSNICNQINWKDHRAVLFLDPFGMQVEWKTIEVIASTKAIDMWFLFPISAVNRMLKKSGDISEGWRKKLSSVFGTEDWYEEFYVKSRQRTFFDSGPQVHKKGGFSQISNYIKKRLNSVFAGVAKNPKTLCNSKNSPLFLLCFAVGNPSPKALGLALKLSQEILSDNVR